MKTVGDFYYIRNGYAVTSKEQKREWSEFDNLNDLRLTSSILLDYKTVNRENRILDKAFFDSKVGELTLINQPTPNILNKHILNPGDILFPSRMGKTESYLFMGQLDNLPSIIAFSFYHVAAPKNLKEINPKFGFIYFNTPQFRELLSKQLSGPQAVLSIEKLSQMPFPALEMDLQNKIVEIYEKRQQEKIEVLKQEEMKDLILNNTLNELFQL